jgi:hypothetical protein
MVYIKDKEKKLLKYTIITLILLFCFINLFFYLDSLWLKRILYYDLHETDKITPKEFATHGIISLKMKVPIKEIWTWKFKVEPSWIGFLTLHSNAFGYQNDMNKKYGLITIINIPDTYTSDDQKERYFFIRMLIIFGLYSVYWDTDRYYYTNEGQKDELLAKVKLFLDIVERDTSFTYRIKRLLGLDVDKSTFKDKLKEINLKDKQ